MATDGRVAADPREAEPIQAPHVLFPELRANAQRDLDEELQALGRLRMAWVEMEQIVARIEALKSTREGT